MTNTERLVQQDPVLRSIAQQNHWPMDERMVYVTDGPCSIGCWCGWNSGEVLGRQGMAQAWCEHLVDALLGAPPGRSLMADLNRTDGELLTLYEVWSEEHWRASFMSPFPDVVAAFHAWLTNEVATRQPVEDYEREMLARYRTLLGAPAATAAEAGVQVIDNEVAG